MSGQRRALIVASDEYEHEGLKHLVAPAADAEALARVLGDDQVGGFDVRVVHNEPSHVIEGEIEDLFSESRPDDVLLLHFSCHGLKSESGELFFAARNTRPNRLGSTATAADFVQRCMRASRSRSIVLLLDCCYGGAFAQGVTVRASGDVNVLDAFPGGKLGGGRGRAVITASSAMEYAFDGDRLSDEHSPQPSVFTSALVEGLATGDADRDEDGWVSLNELYDYVFDKVRERNPHQTPSRDVEMQGELYLARSRRQRIRAAPIPPDLDAARTDPNMYTRLGAIAELRLRLTGDDLEAALGARDALAETARTDIRYVAEPAKAALNEAVLHIADTELHFGQVEQHSLSPHRTVRLLGPPIARTCVPHASHDWLYVHESADGLDISIDTARVGVLRGSVDVKGPTGEAVVTVDVDLIAGPAELSKQALPSVPPAERERAGDRILTVDAPSKSSEVAGPEAAEPEQEPSGKATPAAGWMRHRRVIYAGVLILLAAAGTTAGLLISNNADSPGGSGSSTGGASFAAGATFSAQSPWRLVISDRISGNDQGCTVTVTKTETGEKTVVSNYGTESHQMQISGNLRWDANDVGCLVIRRPGPGKAVLPFAQQYATGDTDAFHTPGQVAVEVKDFNGGDRCDLVLHDAADGRAVDFGTARPGGPLLLNTYGRAQVYLADLDCSIRVAAA